MSGSRLTPPDRNTARGGTADGYGTPPRNNTYGDDPLNERMTSRGKTSGFTGSNGAGVSAADINRGHMNVGEPPGTPARDSWERQEFIPRDRSRQTPSREGDGLHDSYDGGFLDRDPFQQHERG